MYRDDKIRSIMAARKMTFADLADKTGISRQQLGAIAGGGVKDVKLSSLEKIAGALGLKLVDLFEERSGAAA